MRRHLPNLLTVVSALGLLVVTWSCVASNFQVRRAPAGLVLLYGQPTWRSMPIFLGAPLEAASFTSGLNRATLAAKQSGGWSFSALGFHYVGHDKWTILVAPYWFLVTATALAPAHWLWRKRTDARRRQTGACRACGYDLRGSPGRCPVCGAEPPP